MRFIHHAAVAAVAIILASANAADAATLITYTGTHHVGNSTINLSITTDGTIGAVAFVNVLQWTVNGTAPGGGFNMFYNGPGVANSNATLDMGGNQHFDATSSTLSFAYPNIFVQQQTNHEIGFRLNPGFADYYSFGGGSTYNFAYGEYVNFGGNAQSAPLTTTFTVAKVGGFNDLSSSVPEPITWTLTVAGFAAVGFGMRRRPRQPRGAYVPA